MKLLIIIAGFLVITIGLILVQPNTIPQEVAVLDTHSEDETHAEHEAHTETMQTAVSTPVRQVVGLSTNRSEVTRSSTSLLSLSSSAPHLDVSKRLRHPIRLDGHHHDLNDMSHKALAKFGHDESHDEKVHALLVQALSEGQSDAYIGALFDSLASKGKIEVPAALRTASGGMNTVALLQALAEQCNH